MWTKRTCRVCGRSDPPRSLFPNVPKMTSWVACELCQPERWFHLMCLGSKEKSLDDSYHCEKEINVNKSVVLKSGELLLKRRTTQRIRSCGGCNVPINKLPLTSPENLIFMKKEKRLKKNKKLATAVENDFVASNVHYHVNLKCTGAYKNILESEDVQITAKELRHLQSEGFYLKTI